MVANNQNIIDITHSVEEGMPIYPGNPEVNIDKREGETSTHSRLVLGTHTGTHVDAPRHVFTGGTGVADMKLEKLIGSCQVIDATDKSEKIEAADLADCGLSAGDRILIKTTNSKRGFDTFYDDFVYLDGEAADWLAEKGISLFGIDYLSVKKRGGQDNRPHTSLLEKEIAIIEGVNLSGVEPGTYRLVCLPLKLKDGDGAPARCVLLA